MVGFQLWNWIPRKLLPIGESWMFFWVYLNNILEIIFSPFLWEHSKDNNHQSIVLEWYYLLDWIAENQTNKLGPFWRRRKIYGIILCLESCVLWQTPTVLPIILEIAFSQGHPTIYLNPPILNLLKKNTFSMNSK